jgi:Predicted hydrolases or acyltransferases (alpha/beta hydrolase superfamily)
VTETITRSGATIAYSTAGSGNPVCFIGELGLGPWQWSWQFPAVAGPFKAIIPERRGVGHSASPSDDYDIKTIRQDILAVLAACDVRRAHFVGFGVGGLIALSMAQQTHRVASLTLIGTAATRLDRSSATESHWSPPQPASVRRRISDEFSAVFLDSHPDILSQLVEWRCDEDSVRCDMERQRDAVAAINLADALYEITAPSLVIHGTADSAWPIEAGRTLARDLPKGTFHAIEDAGHFVQIEAAAPVNDLLVTTLEEHET